MPPESPAKQQQEEAQPEIDTSKVNHDQEPEDRVQEPQDPVESEVPLS